MTKEFFLIWIHSLAVLTAACSSAWIKQVPLSMSVPRKQGEIQWFHKTILLDISEELRSKIIQNKPSRMKGTFTYQLAVGKSITMSLLKFMKAMFENASLSMSSENSVKYDYLLRAEIIQCIIKQGITIGSQHEIDLKMRFFLYDAQDQLLTDFLISGGGVNEMTSNEIAAHVLVPGEAWNQSGYVESIGRTWDAALADVLNNLVLRISQFLMEGNDSKKQPSSVSGVVIKTLDGTPDNNCKTNQDCPGTKYCAPWGKCSSPCNADTDCPQSMNCSSFGECLTP